MMLWVGVAIGAVAAAIVAVVAFIVWAQGFYR